jgi:hypothetical protein
MPGQYPYFQFSKFVDDILSLYSWKEHFKARKIRCFIVYRPEDGYSLWRYGEEAKWASGGEGHYIPGNNEDYKGEIVQEYRPNRRPTIQERRRATV